MKKTLSVLTNTSLTFTLSTVLYLAIWYFFNTPDNHLSTLFSLLVACFIACVIQFFWFYSSIVRHMRYAVRLLCFVITLYPVLLAYGLVAGWFAPGYSTFISLALFSTIFFTIFIVMTLCYGILFRKTLGSYKEALEAYRIKSKMTETPRENKQETTSFK